MEAQNERNLILKNGMCMPRLGFGCYKVGPDEIYTSATEAAHVGYRHFDTAAFYENEEGVGRAIRECGVKRDALFVTTKLWPTAFSNPDAAITQSLTKLNIGYVDAFLLHWPGTDEGARACAWEALLRRVEKGDIRVAGVSNFMPEHLQQHERRFGCMPEINQIELHPWYQQRELAAVCREKKIAVTAWRPICRGEILNDPTLLNIGTGHGKTAAQVILRWHLQHGNIAIPKSTHAARIRENFDVFDFALSPEELALLDAMERGKHFSKDPFTFAG